MEKCLVAMSGGVDSSVCCYLLKQEGVDIAGATMLLLDNEESYQAINDAREVCSFLGIKHYVFDLREDFRKSVINNFIETYKNGETPNPCVYCNKKFKFGLFYQEALKLGYNKIATGHYARITEGKLYRCDNLDKDQSYFLYGINKDTLNHVIFPLSRFSSKEEVREIAQNANLKVFNKKDSQEVCFVPNDDYKAFLKDKIKENRVGEICLEDGTVLAYHKGIHQYTIGQRKGLNIAYSYPLYVTRIDLAHNRVVVGKNEDLMHDTLIAEEIELLVDTLPRHVLAKIRSRGTLEEATIAIIDNKQIKVVFKRAQRAITKGQSIVFYEKNQCLGGGIIKDVL